MGRKGERVGTRHLTVAKIDGAYKIAQYGQWDGYPEGQGLTVLAFAHKLKDIEVTEQFKRNLRRCRWLDKYEAEKLNEQIGNGIIHNLLREFPQYHRDTGADILDFVLSSTSKEIVLENSFSFAFDHIFCEYIWGVDMDTDEFGLYCGADATKELVPVKTWHIAEAPTKEAFLKAFEA